MASTTPTSAAGGAEGLGAARLRRFKRVVGDWLPVVPFMILGGGLLIASAVWLVIGSFHSPSGEWNLDAWQRIFKPGKVYRGSIVTSVQVSLWTCTICTVVGAPLAWYMHHLRGRGKAFAIGLTNTAANFVGVSLARAFVSTLGAAGFLTLLIRRVTGIELGDDLYSRTGLVAVFCYFTIPLFVLLVLPAMAAIKPAWWEAVQVASGNRWTYWRYVGLPVLAPFVLSGWVLTFAWAMGQYAVVAALLGSESGVHTIPLQIGDLIGKGSVFGNQSQLAAAYAVLLMLIAVLALAAYLWLARRPLKRLEGM
jgi:putative spermidine/putrescine transport system permease protein